MTIALRVLSLCLEKIKLKENKKLIPSNDSITFRKKNIFQTKNVFLCTKCWKSRKCKKTRTAMLQIEVMMQQNKYWKIKKQRLNLMAGNSCEWSQQHWPVIYDNIQVFGNCRDHGDAAQSMCLPSVNVFSEAWMPGGGRADAEHAEEAWRGHYPPWLLRTRHESGRQLSPPLAAAAVWQRGHRDGRWAWSRSRGATPSPRLCLYSYTCVSPPYTRLSHILGLSAAGLCPWRRQRRITHGEVLGVQPGTSSPLCQTSPFVFRSRPLSLTSIIHLFFFSPVFSFVEIQEAVFPASPRNISGYSSTRVLFCPRSAARHRPLFNLLPLMTVKQAKVQVPTLRETRINLQ